MRAATAIFLMSAVQAFTWAAEDHLPKGWQLIYEQSFEKEESIKGFQMTDSAAWKISKASIATSFFLISSLISSGDLFDPRR